MNTAVVRAELVALVERAKALLEKFDEEQPDVVLSPWMPMSTYAEYAGVSYATIRKLVHQGLPHVGKGKLIRIHRDQADAWRKAR